MSREARSRVALAAAAGAVGLGALFGLDGLADRLLSAHMLQHMLLGDVSPLLLVLAIRGRLPGILARVRPAPAFLVWATALAVWHVPALYDAALENDRLHALEHASFAAGGFLVWSVLLDATGRGRAAGWRGFGYAVLLLAASAVLSNVLVLSYRPLYGAYTGADGISPLRDQDLAALVMMGEQLVTVGGFAVLRARSLLQAQAAPAAAPGTHRLAL